MVLVIDVQGARKVREQRLRAATVFVMPPSFAVLEQRLRGRSKDSEEAIQRRLQVARDEVASFADYDFIVINDELRQLGRSAAGDRARRARAAAKRDAASALPVTYVKDILMIDRTKLPNSFEFVVTAGARARQLLAGSTPRVAVGEHKKTTVAQQEVLTGVVEKVEKADRPTE